MPEARARAGQKMTTRVIWEAAKSTEAEPGRPGFPARPITLHDASLGGDMAGVLPKVNVGRAGEPS